MKLFGRVAVVALSSVGAMPVVATQQATTAPARAPGFAAELAERPLPAAPDAWPRISDADAWAKLTRASPAERQATRWDYARGLIARDRPSDALGVLTAMRIDDPDLTLVPAWRRAQGAALTMLGRTDEALLSLGEDSLLADAESCLWRMRALADSGKAAQALAHLRCAMPALRARTNADRLPFIVAAGRAAIAVGKHAPALGWLQGAPDSDPAANLLRGRALLALGRVQEGGLRLDRVKLSGNPEQQADAMLSGIEAAVAAHAIAPAEALKQLDHFRFIWRGGDIERRALFLATRIATDIHDTTHALSSGAILFRYFDLGAGSAPLAQQMGGQIAAALAPGSTVPLGEAAGLMWDYRDLMPGGADGARLVENLVNRLQDAGLYDRAADLLQHRLASDAQDIEQGPLSVRIASLRILAGNPERAVRMLRDTDATPYPATIRADRRRIEAAALELLGKPAEALAALQDVADTDGLRAEIYWRARDWANLVRVNQNTLPARVMSAVSQAIVLRHAIALAMLGQEDALGRLNARYAASFARLPTAPTFAMLTARTGPIDPASLGKAMAALPSASPAGEIGDLIEAGHAALAPTLTKTPAPA